MSATSSLPPTDAALRPPHERGTIRAFLLAALFHLLLIALIAIGVHWRSHAPEAIEAELWSPSVHQAAPRPTAPLERQQPQPRPQPQTPPPAPTPQPQQPSQADIVLQRQRELAALKEKKRLEQLALEQQRKLQAQQRAEQQRLAEEKAQQQAEQRRLQQREQQEKQRLQKLAEQKKQEERKRLEQQQAQLAASSRADYMKQLMAQAGTGASNSIGTAARSSGPSGAYAARIAGLVKQNVIFPEISQIDGDPKVVITVRLDPNSGEVLGSTITRSSGVPSWDQAVLRAIQRVGRFPPDEHGNWYTPMEIKAGPRDPG